MGDITPPPRDRNRFAPAGLTIEEATAAANLAAADLAAAVVCTATAGDLAAAALGEQTLSFDTLATLDAAGAKLEGAAAVGAGAENLDAVLKERLAALAAAEAMEVAADERVAADNAAADERWTGRRGVAKIDGLAAEAQSPGVNRLFSRGLTSTELVEVRALLEPAGRSRLRELVEREYSWALSSGQQATEGGGSSSGLSPPAPEGSTQLAYPGALIALRQLSYLNGLPALDSDTACGLFDMHSAGFEAEDGDRCISVEEFEAVFVHLLRAALEGTPRQDSSAASTGRR